MTKHSMLGRAARFWVAVCFTAAAASGVASCGDTTKTGTDSHTHWLEHCTSDSECGALDCICGRCTKTCDDTPDCDGLDSGATCTTASCQEQDAAGTCAKVCETNADCQAAASDLECKSGVCVDVPREPDPCQAMDARDNGTECAAVAGYAFDGLLCRPILCGCAGTDCDAIYDTQAECDAAYTACYAGLGLDQACTTHADCQLVPRACCGGLIDAEQVVATATISDSFREALCEGVDGCPTIYIPPRPSLYAVCEQGRCMPLDIEPVALCDADQDCTVRTKDCCNCPAGAPAGELIAVSLPDEYGEFAACDVDCLCDEGPIVGASAACNQDFNLCELVIDD